ncbi:MAG: twin-arginine translocation signal domain-containing protein [Hyphomicrobiaceae bacterium]
MDRRTFLKTTGGAAGAVAAGGVGLAANGGEAAADQAAPAKPAVISARHEIAIEVRLPAAAPVLGELAGRLSRRIARMSAGAIQLVPLAGIDRVADVAILDLVGQDPDAPLADRLFAGLPLDFPPASCRSGCRSAAARRSGTTATAPVE